MHTKPPRSPAAANPPGPPRRSDDADAFLPDPQGGPARVPDDFAELVAEDFIASATSGEEQTENERNQIVPEELGGPFISTTAEEELADDVDANNPEGSEVEPFPRALGGGR